MKHLLLTDTKILCDTVDGISYITDVTCTWRDVLKGGSCFIHANDRSVFSQPWCNSYLINLISMESVDMFKELVSADIVINSHIPPGILPPIINRLQVNTQHFRLYAIEKVNELYGNSVCCNEATLAYATIIKVTTLELRDRSLYVESPTCIQIASGVNELSIGKVCQDVTVELDWSSFYNLQVDSFEQGGVILKGYLHYLTEYPDSKTWGHNFLNLSFVKNGELYIDNLSELASAFGDIVV